jgi:hypothetical protein
VDCGVVGWRCWRGCGRISASLGGGVGVDLGWVSASLGNGVGVSVDFWPCLVAMSAWVWVSFGVIGVRRGCGISASLSNGVGVGLASLRLRLVTGGATLADLGNHFRHFDAFWLTLGPLFDDFGCLYKNCTVAQFPMRGHSNDCNCWGVLGVFMVTFGSILDQSGTNLDQFGVTLSAFWDFSNLFF